MIHGSIMPRNDLQFESHGQKRGWLMPVVHRFGGCYVHFLVLDACFEECLLLGGPPEPVVECQCGELGASMA